LRSRSRQVAPNAAPVTAASRKSVSMGIGFWLQLGTCPGRRRLQIVVGPIGPGQREHRQQQHHQDHEPLPSSPLRESEGSGYVNRPGVGPCRRFPGRSGGRASRRRSEAGSSYTRVCGLRDPTEMLPREAAHVLPARGESYPVRPANAVRPLIYAEPAFRRICEAVEEAESSVWVGVPRSPAGSGTLRSSSRWRSRERSDTHPPRDSIRRARRSRRSR
jgi:hypothetical protein